MIVLIGFMGAGKTTIGNLLAARLGLPFTDTDQLIEQRAGRPIARIFAEDGEPAFRALEHQVIAELLDGPDMIVALGGGAAEHPRTQDKLSTSPAAQVVYLEVAYDLALRRIGGDSGRPMLARPDLAAVYERRRHVYSRLATLTIGTDDCHPESVGDEILTRLLTPKRPA